MKPIDRSSGKKSKNASRTTAISLPFWDDFSASGTSPDTTLWQIGDDIFVNNTLGINPPSINVATFDGARADGQPHNASQEVAGPADSLVSCPINLAEVPASLLSTVRFSFFYEIQGAGEIPEEGDSLSLFFLDSANNWHNVWTREGGEVFNFTNFVPENFVVSDFQRDTIYFFHESFQFKFVSYSSQRGIFDTWHLDYIYLNQNRTAFDRVFDRAAANQPGPLFGPYHHLPMIQYKDSSLFSIQEVVLNNLDIGAPHPFSYTQSLTNNVADTIISTIDITNQLLLSGASDTFAGFESLDPDLLLGDSLLLTSEFVFFTGDLNLFQEIDNTGDTIFLDVDLKVNDTVRSFHSLHETLAYDDGSAEFAAGINLDRGQLAVRYALNTPDTLTHIQVHFPSLPNSAGQSINIKVWDRLSETGEQIVQQHIIENGPERNAFAEIQLNRPLIVSDTFFIGYEQFTDEYIGIGLDRSNVLGSEHMFFNVTREWQQNVEIQGALMIRPIFRNTAEVVLITPTPSHEQVILYPNPAQGIIQSTLPFERLEMYNLSGQLVLKTDYEPTIHISNIPDGIYLVRIYEKDAVQVTKLIIQQP